MKDIKVLDCTLRDGGYVVDSIFGNNNIKGIIKNLCKVGIDVIEVGFLKDIEHVSGSSTFRTVEEISEYLPKERTNVTSFVVMVDYGRYSIENLSNYDGKTIDAIRVCFFREDSEKAIEFAKDIIDKGYKVYVQPVDILGYDDNQLLELIKKANAINPYAFSIVDTFGSMYSDDLQRVFSLIDHNLKKDIRVGLHSHNNLQLSFSLAQDFIKMSTEKRKIIIDATLCGMGRGAGNTHTELIVDYLNRKMGFNYDINELLDLIDIYMSEFTKEKNWGYSIPYFIAGIHDSHVHNISYLMEKHKINAKDMKLIIASIEKDKRKRYDYDNLEKTYIDYFNKKVSDDKSLEYLKEKLQGKKILLLAPGKSILEYKEKINNFIDTNSPVVIPINFTGNDFKTDFMFFSNPMRYKYAKNKQQVKFNKYNKIVTSNIKTSGENDEIIVNYNLLIKQGYKYFDNSVLMLIRLLIKIGINQAHIAGFDGQSKDEYNSYVDFALQTNMSKDEKSEINEETSKMLDEIINSKQNSLKLNFLTPSNYLEFISETINK